jgi:DMSO/TMAO reductase YedYZ molybdopterin-dependent catalytic subunit
MTRRIFLLTSMSFAVGLTAYVGAAQPATTLRISGAVAQPLTLSAADIASMPHQGLTVTAHDQTDKFEGVSMRALLTRAGVPAGDELRGSELAKTVLVTGADGYRVAFGLAEFDPAFTDRTSILADRRGGGPLPANALPFQLVLSDEKRPARWVRQVVSIEIVAPGR